MSAFIVQKMNFWKKGLKSLNSVDDENLFLSILFLGLFLY